METDIYYVNFGERDTKGTTRPQTPSRRPDEGKARKYRGSRCLVLMAVCLGLICVLQLVDSSTGVLQFIMITEERDLLKTYKNTVEEINQTIKSEVTSLRAELKKAYEKGYQWGFGWFFISNVSMSWSDIRQYCRDQGGDLIIINTEEKQKFITSKVNERVWIGLSDMEQEGNMKWVNNLPLGKGFWIEAQPDDYRGSEDCVELLPGPVLNWNDLPCSAMRKGICEK